MKTTVFAAVAALVLGATAAQADTLYSNTFEGGSTAGFSAGLINVTPLGGIHFLGKFTNGGGGDGSNGGGTTVLTLNTAGYSNVILNFDVYALLSVDGDNFNGGPGGNSPGNPDSFIVTGDGGQQILVSGNSFANYPGQTQTYGPAAENGPQTGAVSANTFGYCGPACTDDAIYHFSLSFAPTAGGTTLLTFVGHANQDINDEYFGLDNVLVTGERDAGPGGVPEPATWAMMLMGFGLAGAALRRRSAYRLVEIAADGTRSSEEFRADDDQSALAQALEVSEGVAIEVWRGDRMVQHLRTDGLVAA